VPAITAQCGVPTMNKPLDIFSWCNRTICSWWVSRYISLRFIFTKRNRCRYFIKKKN